MSGLTWTADTTPSGKFFYGVAYSSNLATAVAHGDDFVSGTRYTMATVDGVNWTKNVLVGNHALYTLVYATNFNAFSGLWVGGGYNGTTGDPVIMTSPDAITWTIRQTVLGGTGMFCSAYSPQLGRCVVAGDAGKIYYSDDGITWNNVSTGASTFQAIGWGPGLRAPLGSGLITGQGVFTAITSTSKEVYVSTDGITWFHSTTLGPDQRVNSAFAALRVTWVPQLGKFFGDSGNWQGKINISTDGLNWSTAAIPIQAMADFAWSGIALVGVGTDGVNASSASSLDGVTWTIGTVAATTPLDRVTYTNNVLSLYLGTKVHTTDDTTTTAFKTIFEPPWWHVDLAPSNGGAPPYWNRLFTTSPTKPDPYVLNQDLFWQGVFYPAGTTFDWVLEPIPPSDTGWWESVDEAFAGGAQVLAGGVRPTNPRGYPEVSAFATGSANMFGGLPSCIFNNHLIYAQGGYTVGTTNPVIRIFDGTFDRPVVSLPNTSGGTVPKAVMTLLTANDTIYLATFDTGNSDANWTGRVFSLDIETGTLAPIGTPFSAEVPYALTFHAGRLWLGTMVQNSANSGHIYYFRTDVDTAWTLDRTLSASGVAGCTALQSFKGKLYVATSAPNGTFAKILVRDTLGAYSTADTGSGGTARANNAYTALLSFNGALYAAYWNPDNVNMSILRRSTDGASWSTVYTGVASTAVPYIGFPTDGTVLLALGGGAGQQAALLSTSDGTTWADRSIFLPQGSPVSTATPAFGVVRV